MLLLAWLSYRADSIFTRLVCHYLWDELPWAWDESRLGAKLWFEQTGHGQPKLAAFGQFKTSNRPYVYTYFRDTDIKAASARRDDLNSLWQFQDKLKATGHYPTDYDGVEHLKRHFRDQLDQLLEMVPLESSRDDGVPTSQQPAKRWWQTLLGYFR